MVKQVLFFSIVLLTQVCHAQKRFSVNIQLPASMDPKKVFVEIDDGQSVVFHEKAFNTNKATFTGTIHAKYATITLQYVYNERRGHLNDYLLKEGHSSLVFSECRKGDSSAFPFDSCKLLNAIEVRKLPEAKKLMLFTAHEDSVIAKMLDASDYYFYNGDESKNDSLTKIYNDQSQLILQKQMTFVQQNINSYFSFWLFRRKFTYFNVVEPFHDTLSKLFSSFPAAFRNSFEGQWILKKMNGALYVKKGFKAPNFTAKENSGTTINLSNYRGKYVLLQFWASWCGPCLEEIPMIKKIHSTYPKEKLAVIGVSIDGDRTDFLEAVNKNNINWINILDDKRIINSLYGDKPIPSIYLINKEGKIVYSSWEESFEILNDLLSKAIK